MKRNYFAFEHRKEALLSRRDFLTRLAVAGVWAVILLGIWLIAGMIGYHWLANLTWIDSFLNASMIVGGMGPVDALTSSSSKVFAGFYAILSGVIFLSIFGLLLAPLYHRFLHRFHLDAEK
jgi:hypothetical protein